MGIVVQLRWTLPCPVFLSKYETLLIFFLLQIVRFFSEGVLGISGGPGTCCCHSASVSPVLGLVSHHAQLIKLFTLGVLEIEFRCSYMVDKRSI